MKIKLSLFIALLLIAATCTYFYQQRADSARSEKEMYDLHTQIESLKDQIGLNEVTWNDNGIVLPDSVKLLLAGYGHHELRHKKLLVIRYSELNCNTCVEKFMQITKAATPADEPVVLILHGIVTLDIFQIVVD